MGDSRRLSDKSVTVLRLIAEGKSYAHIVDGHSDISYLDIFNAAKEALRLNESTPGYEDRIASIKARHPRAYERWTDAEDEELVAMHGQGLPVIEIASRLKRQPSAIQSRLAKQGLSSPDGKPEED